MMLLFILVAAVVGHLLKRNWKLLRELNDLSSQLYFTDAFITQTSLINPHMEAAPFLWEKKIYYLVTAREESKDFKGLTVHDLATNKVVNQLLPGHGLASTLTHLGKILITSTVDWYQAGQSRIDLTILDDPFDASPQTQTIISASKDQTFFNTSITFDEEKKVYVLAYELREKGLVDFSARFLTSHDLKTWLPAGTTFAPDIYAACPTLRKIKGHYYIWFLATGGDRHLVYQTKVARSTDLIHWTTSPYPFLTPVEGEGVNASDFDFITLGSQTHFFYADGDQRTKANIRYGIMGKPLEEFVELFFRDKAHLDAVNIKLHTPSQTIRNALRAHIRI